MKNIIKNIRSVILMSLVVTGGVFTVSAQEYYDTGTTYPTYDTGTSYSGSYDTGTTYPTYNTGTTYPTYNTGTTYPTYDTGTTYPTYYTGTTYPTYDTGTTYPTYDTGTTYPTYNTGTTYPTYDTGTTYPTYYTGTTYPTYDTGTTYPTYNTGTTYPSYNTGTTYPTYDTGTTYPTYDTGTTYPTYNTGTTNPTYNTGTTYSNATYSTGTTYPNYSTGGVTYPTYGNTNQNQTVPVVTTISCPTGSRLINGQCLSTVTGNVITTTSCPTGTVVSGTDCLNTVNGTVVTRIVCTTGTLTNGQCVNTVAGNLVTNITCPTGSTLTNGKCVNTITGTIITNITCPTGANLVNGQCVNTITGSVVTNVICPSGSNNVNGQCITTVTPPVTTVTNCPSNTTFVNGTCQQIINPPVVVNQTCWDGSVIPATSICAPQYKVCANGVSVPVTQACYVPPTPVYVPKQVIKFNNVVTSLATQVTNTSGRCNGIGLIANNAQSTGWFEYGETTNLGRTTASAQIGSSDTAPFSNVLANLKPSAKYYCRAVMQNQYGVVKGEIVSFTTTAKATTYVKPVAVTKKPVAKTPVKTNTITCSDGTTVQTKNQTSATLLSQGEKLISLQIEKVSGKLTAGDSVTYKVNYKNLIDARLSGIVVKIALPQEIEFASTTVGTFDEGTRTLTLSQNTIDPYTEGTILISGTIAKNAPIGKTIITNAYVAYTVPGTNTQDEVTAYVIGSIVPNTEISKSDTGAKNVIGQNVGKGFMPSTLIEWLALLAIVFIIFILGRSVYASYKDDKQAPAHH